MTQTNRYIDHKEPPTTGSLSQDHDPDDPLFFGGIINRVLIALAF